MRIFLAIALTVATCSKPHAPRLYVTNERSGTITVIDTATDRVIDTIKVGARPRGIIFTGRKLFAALTDLPTRGGKIAPGRKGIAEVDASTGRVNAVYDGGTDPETLSANKDGSRLYVSNEDAGTATIIDTQSGKPVSTLLVGIEPEGVATSPDGRWVYVTSETSNTVAVIDAQKQRVAASFMVEPRPRAATFSPDGKTAWISSEVGGTVSLVDVATNTITDVIQLPNGVHPVGMAMTRDGGTLFVAGGHADSICVIDTKQRKLAGVIPVGKRPWNVALTPDEKKLYAANGLSNDVSVIDVARRRVVATIAAGEGPWGLAVERAQ